MVRLKSAVGLPYEGRKAFVPSRIADVVLFLFQEFPAVRAGFPVFCKDFLCRFIETGPSGSELYPVACPVEEGKSRFLLQQVHLLHEGGGSNEKECGGFCERAAFCCFDESFELTVGHFGLLRRVESILRITFGERNRGLGIWN